MTPGAEARSRLNRNPSAMVAGCDQEPSRLFQNRNAAAPSFFGSSQLRIGLPFSLAVTRGVMLPTGAGVASSLQPFAVIREPGLTLQPARPTIENGTAAVKPSAAEAWSNFLRVISIFFMAILSPLNVGTRPTDVGLRRIQRQVICGAVSCGTTFLAGRAMARQSVAVRHAQQRDRGGVRFLA